MAVSVFPLHTGPDGHGLDGSVGKQGYRSGLLCGQFGVTSHTGADGHGLDGLVYKSKLSIFNENSVLHFKSNKLNLQQPEYTLRS